jgi:hypothetical protein
VVLEILRGGMTRVTYESIVQNCARPIGRQNGSLVIGVSSFQAWEWLENRWKPAVERAVKIAFGEELRVEFRLEAADDPGA